MPHRRRIGDKISIASAIKELISKEKLTKYEFTRRVGVSAQSVEKWESDATLPNLEEAVSIAKAFGISLDALMRGEVTADENGEIKPKYEEMHDWEFYASALPVEYRQSPEEGLDIEEYEEIFSSVGKLPKGEIKKSSATSSLRSCARRSGGTATRTTNRPTSRGSWLCGSGM